MAAKEVSWGSIFLFLLLIFCEKCYSILDHRGFIWHNRRVGMYKKGDWPQGESRRCMGLQRNDDDGLFAVFCPEDPDGATYQDSPIIKFWGRVSRPNTLTGDIGATYRWNCTKDKKRYVCKAID
jgi:hypothetical protein